MPALVAEAQIHPSDLFSQSGKEDEEWCVLHTKPRCEKTLARILLQERISFFLPQGQSRRKVQRRWVTTSLPLFPGYLFLYGTEHSRLTALQTNKVVSTLTVNDQDQLQNELSALYQVVCSGNEVKAEPRIEEGDHVEVVHGSLVGLRGTASRCDGLTRVIIEVMMLGRGVSVQVEDWMLRKI